MKKLPLIIGISSLLITLGITGAIAYKWIAKQVKALENYTTRFSRIVVRKVSLTELSFDVFTYYKNNSNLTITLAEQEYEVYANNIYISTFQNKANTTLKAQSESELGIRINLDPSQLIAKIGINAVDLLKNPKDIKMKIIMKYKVSVLGIKVTIPPIQLEESLAYFIGSK